MKKGYVFVYGTLMDGFWNYEKHLKPHVIGKWEAWVSGTLYHLREGYPALLEGDNPVYGNLVQCRQFDKAIAILDRLEGYHGPGHTNLYERITKAVFLHDGEVFEAFTYVYSPARLHEVEKFGILIPSGSWREYIEERKAVK
ncbi:gamma-glutamylcyclotransferase [Metallumcola ferriviriculae]|uniref:Gamma-glutamylcyclotransferase n=1 Tax=Metallumcola ferriviriculae TaxID=3039180 RepID=A0AAU0UNV4_9FIRM|nr:gamma-glutamylcyclotransferase [Desulfitibacteraceae bacterium MK1]